MVAYGVPHFPHKTAPEKFKAMYPPEKIQLPPNVPPALHARARQEARPVIPRRRPPARVAGPRAAGGPRLPQCMSLALPPSSFGAPERLVPLIPARRMLRLATVPVYAESSRVHPKWQEQAVN